MGSEIFGVLFEHGSEAAFSVDRKTCQILSANRQLEDLIGRSRESLIGLSASEMFLSDERVGDWPEQILSRAGLHEEVALKRLDDYPIYVSLTVAHIQHTQQGDVVACIARDTTERRRLERELISKHTALYSAHAELEQAFRCLRETQHRLEERNRELSVLGAQLAQAAHRAAIGEFSAGIAHSMNNPIGAASSALKQIEKQVQQHGDPQLIHGIERFFRRGQHALSRMENIVSSVRRAHRSGSIDAVPKTVKVVDEIEIILTLFEARLNNIEVVREYIPDATAWVPSDALYHVASNVIDNAIRAMPHGGHLRIQVQEQQNETLVFVSDNGDGIADAVKNDLFEPFASARKDGTGLGLCMARRLARKWGGDVALVPSQKGACFEIRMPSKESK